MANIFSIGNDTVNFFLLLSDQVAISLNKLGLRERLFVNFLAINLKLIKFYVLKNCKRLYFFSESHVLRKGFLYKYNISKRVEVKDKKPLSWRKLHKLKLYFQFKVFTIILCQIGNDIHIFLIGLYSTISEKGSTLNKHKGTYVFSKRK